MCVPALTRLPQRDGILRHAREVPPHRRARPRRHGRGLPRGRARPRGLQQAAGHQADPAAARRRPRVRQHVPRRGAARGPPQPPERRADQRGRQEGAPTSSRWSTWTASRSTACSTRLGATRLRARRCSLRIVATRSPACTTRTSCADYDGTPLGVVHRDVTPHNVFVTYDGQVKVVDFGIAKAAELVVTRPQAGVLKGKIAYMSPEQAIAAARRSQRPTSSRSASCCGSSSPASGCTAGCRRSP